jgi:hypothetical protein
MAKFFTLDDGKTFYNADHVLKIAKVNPNVQDTVMTFTGGVIAQSPQSIEEVLKLIRAAE